MRYVNRTKYFGIKYSISEDFRLIGYTDSDCGGRSSSLDVKNFKFLLQEQQEPTIVFSDNNSSIMLSKNHVFHKKIKHIDTRYHFMRELVNNKEMCLEFCRSKEQVTEIFTKALARDTFQHLHSSLGVRAVTKEL
jgi:hypothetical protein